MRSLAECETAFEHAVAAHVQRVGRAKTPRADVETMRELRACALELAAALLDYSAERESGRRSRAQSSAAYRLRQNAAVARRAA